VKLPLTGNVIFLFPDCFSPQNKTVVTAGSHGELYGIPPIQSMKDSEVQPFAESGIVNLWMSVPKLRGQTALNTQMIQLKLDHAYAFGKVAASISSADEQARNFTSLALCFHQHGSTRMKRECGPLSRTISSTGGRNPATICELRSSRDQFHGGPFRSHRQGEIRGQIETELWRILRGRMRKCIQSG
jgi:hypothetical protein